MASLRKRIVVSGYFPAKANVVHLKRNYFRRLAYELAKLNIDLDVLDLSWGRIPLELPQGCQHLCLAPRLDKYLGLPSIRSLMKLRLKSVLDITQRQLSDAQHHVNPIRAAWGTCNAMDQVRQLLISKTPDLVVLWFKYTPFHILLDHVCEELKIPRLFVEGGIIPGTIEFDSVGNDGLSWPVRNVEKFNRLSITNEWVSHTESYLDIVKNLRLSRKPQIPSNTLPNGINDWQNPVLFYAGTASIAIDAYAKWSEDHILLSPNFGSNEEVLVELLRLAEKHDYRILYKPHPNESSPSFRSSDRLLIASGANVFDCIRTTHVTLTILSSVSGLALIQGKPSIILGRNGLSGKGAAYEIDEKDDLEDVVAQAIEEGSGRHWERNWLDYATRVTRYYSFAYDEGVAKLIGRDVDEAALMLQRFLQGAKPSELCL